MSNTLAMTSESPPPASPQGPNLMILKGVVIGLGLLLVIGTVLVGVKMAAVSSSPPVDEIAVMDKMTHTSFDLSNLPPLPLFQDEQIVSVSAGEGMILVMTERVQAGNTGPARRRVLAISNAAEAKWEALPVARLEPNSP